MVTPADEPNLGPNDDDAPDSTIDDNSDLPPLTDPSTIPPDQGDAGNV